MTKTNEIIARQPRDAAEQCVQCPESTQPTFQQCQTLPFDHNGILGSSVTNSITYSQNFAFYAGYELHSFECLLMCVLIKSMNCGVHFKGIKVDYLVSTPRICPATCIKSYAMTRRCTNTHHSSTIALQITSCHIPTTG